MKKLKNVCVILSMITLILSSKVVKAEEAISEYDLVQPTNLTCIDGVYYYEISSAEQLQFVAENSDEWLSYNYILVNDISANSEPIIYDDSGLLLTDESKLKEWKPISDFKGIFDGNGYTISNIYINGTDSSVGMFGNVRTEAVIKNVNIIDSFIKGVSSVGGIVGYTSADNDIGIYGCTFSGCVIGTRYVGGIAGQSSGNNSLGPSNCSTEGLVMGETEIGGIVGHSSHSRIKNCENKSKVVATGNFVGGIFGGGNLNYVDQCNNYGNVSGLNYVGGLLGGDEEGFYGTIENSYNFGDINGNSYVGGLTGISTKEDRYYSEALKFTKCGNLGKISGKSYIGGITGYCEGDIIDSYTCNEVFGDEKCGLVVGEGKSIWGTGQVRGCLFNTDISTTLFPYGNIDSSVSGVDGKHSSYFPALLNKLDSPEYDDLGYDIGKGIISDIQDQIYTGYEIKPIIVVKVDDIILENNIDYKVEYTENKKIGVANVIVTGINEYKGQINCSFNIIENGHVYLRPVFKWSEDGKSCKVMYTCKNDESHTIEYDATVTSEVKTEATCTTKGTTTYTAKYGSDTDSKDVQDIAVDASNHVWEKGYTIDVPATETTNGCKSIHCNNCEARKDVTVIDATGSGEKNQKIKTAKSKPQKIKTAKLKTYKAESLKKKKIVFSLKAKTNGNGKLKYKVTKGKSKYITVSKTGKVTLKKGCKKGTYRIIITASATKKYKKVTKVISIKVK